MKGQNDNCAICGLPYFPGGRKVWNAEKGWTHQGCSAQRQAVLTGLGRRFSTEPWLPAPTCESCHEIIDMRLSWPEWDAEHGTICRDCRSLYAGNAAAAERLILSAARPPRYAFQLLLREIAELEAIIQHERRAHEAQIKFRLKPTVTVRPAAPHRDSDSQGTQPDDEV